MASRTMLRLLAFALWSVAGVAGHAKLRLQSEAVKHLMKQHQGPKHRLRVCNAYPYMTALNVFMGKASGITKMTDEAMPYKTCREFEPQLQAGDRIDFRFQQASAGTFVVGDLPNTDAVLMLVIYRHSTKTTAVAFESHVFANLLNAQIAVLDTYKGKEKSTIKIQDAEDATTSRSEPLAPNSVVALNPGKYEVVLVGSDGSAKSRSDLTVNNRESCVVIRCGVEPEEGRAYAQELMVYPVLPPTGAGAIRSSANGRFAPSVASLLMMLALPLALGAA